MLYDPKHEIMLDVLSLESLIAWLEKQPATRGYNYENGTGRCLYGQYMAAHGIKWMGSGACGGSCSSEARVDFCMLVYDRVASPRPWTLGAALERAREALAHQQC